MKRITNKMLADEFGKSEQNFKQIQPDLKRVYLDAFRWRRAIEALQQIDQQQLEFVVEAMKSLKGD